MKTYNEEQENGGLLESRYSRLDRATIAAAVMILCAAVLTMPEQALAAGMGGPLENTYNTLTGWVQGYIGRVITISFMIVGTVAGVIKQSLMAFAVGIGAGLGIYNTPTIIEAIFTAAI